MSNIRKKSNTTTITQIALFAALQCVISPFAIVFPFSPVPISLATLMLYLSAYILGKNKTVISCGIYLLIGFVGLPVFSGFTGGIGKILGPTGGYMLGYLFLVYISGWFIETWSVGSIKRGLSEKWHWKYYVNYLMQGIGMVLGTVVCYLFGSMWLAYQSNMNIASALTVGALPFIPGDVVKILIGVLVGAAMRKRLVKAGML